MKNIKNFEGYFYNNDGKIYQDEDMENAPDSFWKSKPLYIVDELGDFIPELTNIKKRIEEIAEELESYGPIDEDLVDTVESLSKILNKWENRPINKDVKKYNL